MDHLSVAYFISDTISYNTINVEDYTIYHDHLHDETFEE